MFNGKLKLSQDRDTVIASITVQAPKGPVTLTASESIAKNADAAAKLGIHLDDAGMQALGKKTAALAAIHKLERPLEHFDVTTLVDPKAAQEASSLWKTMTGGVSTGSEPKPASKSAAAAALAKWKTYQAAVLAGDVYAMDVDYVLRRLARDHNKVYVAKNYQKLSGDDSMAGFFDNLGNVATGVLTNIIGSGDTTVLQAGMNVVAAIPGVSDFASSVTAMAPGLAGFVDKVVDAANGSADARSFVSQTVALANAGVASAQADAAKLKQAQDLLNKTPGLSRAGGVTPKGGTSPRDAMMAMVPTSAKVLWGLVKYRTAAADAAAHAKDGVPHVEGMSLWDIGLFFGNKNLPSISAPKVG